MNKSLFILCCIILHSIAIFINVFGQLVAFPVIGLLFSFGGVYLLKNNPFKNKRIGYFLIFGIYPLMIFGAFIYSFFEIYNRFLGYPITFILFISIIFAFFVHKKNNRQLIKICLGYFIFLVASSALLPNYFNWQFQIKYNIVEKNLPDLKIFDENANVFDLKKLDGKIIVLDIWSSSCGICIKKFPDFEKLKDQFLKDSSIVFYTLNLPIERSFEKKQDVNKYTNPYTFEKLYADKNVQSQLGIKAVPQYMIIDKNKKVRYLGNLNTGKTEFYNNFYTIIDKIK